MAPARRVQNNVGLVPCVVPSLDWSPGRPHAGRKGRVGAYARGFSVGEKPSYRSELRAIHQLLNTGPSHAIDSRFQAVKELPARLAKVLHEDPTEIESRPQVLASRLSERIRAAGLRSQGAGLGGTAGRVVNGIGALGAGN
jgi:hypothetical protein